MGIYHLSPELGKSLEDDFLGKNAQKVKFSGKVTVIEKDPNTKETKTKVPSYRCFRCLRPQIQDSVNTCAPQPTVWAVASFTAAYAVARRTWRLD